MRGKISDQDLTDYALNELQPEDRLYVESMFAVSEECRHDVYQMIELSQLLEQGFEEEDAKAHPLLTGSQRQRVLQARRGHGHSASQKIAAVLVAAACVAFTITRTEFAEMELPARQMAVASKQAAHLVADAVSSTDSAEFKGRFETLRAAFTEDSAAPTDVLSWLQTEVIPPTPMVCTPPTIFETAHLTGRSEPTQ